MSNFIRGSYLFNIQFKVFNLQLCGCRISGFDGPSLPSVKCCPSCSSTPGRISLLFVGISFKYTPLRCLKKVSSKDSARGSPKMAGGDPKKAKDIHFFLIWNTTAHSRGVTNWGTLWKWIFPDLCQFFRHFGSEYFLNIWFWFFWNYSNIHLIVMLISHFILNFKS